MPDKALFATSVGDSFPLTIGLVGCGKAKKSQGEWPARDLYIGRLFRLSLEYAERTCEDVHILSAEHGMIPPHMPLRYYDYSTANMYRSEHENWGHRIVGELLRAYPLQRLDITFLAGQQYIWPITKAAFKEQPLWEFHTPLAGLDLFERMAWFKQRKEKPDVP